MERSASGVEAKLLNLGIRCKIERHSKSISIDPYVEHTWHVLINDGIEGERGFIQRVVTNIKNGGI